MTVNPNPHKTKLERAEELDIAAKIAHTKGDYVFALELAQHAHLLRMEDKHNDHTIPVCGDTQR